MATPKYPGIPMKSDSHTGKHLAVCGMGGCKLMLSQNKSGAHWRASVLLHNSQVIAHCFLNNIIYLLKHFKEHFITHINVLVQMLFYCTTLK